jgi:hypothetical protein
MSAGKPRRRIPGDYSTHRVRVEDVRDTDDEFCGLVGTLAEMRRDVNDLRLCVLDFISMPDRDVDIDDLRDLARRLEKIVVRRDLAHMHATNLLPMIIEWQKAKRNGMEAVQ